MAFCAAAATPHGAHGDTDKLQALVLGSLQEQLRLETLTAPLLAVSPLRLVSQLATRAGVMSCARQRTLAPTRVPAAPPARRRARPRQRPEPVMRRCSRARRLDPDAGQRHVTRCCRGPLDLATGQASESRRRFSRPSHGTAPIPADCVQTRANHGPVPGQAERERPA